MDALDVGGAADVGSAPKRPVSSPVGTARALVSGVPDVCLKLWGKSVGSLGKATV